MMRSVFLAIYLTDVVGALKADDVQLELADDVARERQFQRRLGARQVAADLLQRIVADPAGRRPGGAGQRAPLQIAEHLADHFGREIRAFLARLPDERLCARARQQDADL